MKAVKVDQKNAAAVEAALAEVNGRKLQHTYTTFAAIESIAKSAEDTLRDILYKKDFSGAQIVSTSGEEVANAYGYSRTATRVTLERRSSNWYIVDIEAVPIYNYAGRDQISLSAAQDDAAIKKLRQQYLIRS